MDQEGFRIAVIGATGAVGQEVIEVLSARSFPVRELRCFASEKRVGQRLKTPFAELTLEAFTPGLRGLDLIFLAVSGTFAKAHAPSLAQSGAVVIDSSSAFRLDEDVPLLIPEINADQYNDSRLIANPNCTTAILSIPLYPLYKAFGLRRVIVSTYQASSGAGAEGMEELIQGTQRWLDCGETRYHSVFPCQLAFNVIPQVDIFQENAYTREEMKVVWETRKIFGDSSLKISCTAVRVPTLRVHAESVTIETERPITAKAAREILASAPGLQLMDDPGQGRYPTSLSATRQYDVQVGRIRENSLFGDCGLDFFVCGDQLLKGAALNAVQIAEHVLAATPTPA